MYFEDVLKRFYLFAQEDKNFSIEERVSALKILQCLEKYHNAIRTELKTKSFITRFFAFIGSSRRNEGLPGFFDPCFLFCYLGPYSSRFEAFADETSYRFRGFTKTQYQEMFKKDPTNIHTEAPSMCAGGPILKGCFFYTNDKALPVLAKENYEPKVTISGS